MGSDTLIHNESTMTSGSPTLVYLANLTKIRAGNQDPNMEKPFSTIVDTAHQNAAKERDSHDSDDPKTIELRRDKSKKGPTH